MIPKTSREACSPSLSHRPRDVNDFMARSAETAGRMTFARSNMPLKTKRWNDPVETSDGFRLLVCRYRPRGLAKDKETWDEWNPDLGPSRELHAAVYGKHGPPITFDSYRRRYLKEMHDQAEAIGELVRRVRLGETITLLCSSACWDAGKCHRTLLKQLIEARL
jgi:uncharacterized protein YeaO (DUF488 family)